MAIIELTAVNLHTSGPLAQSGNRQGFTVAQHANSSERPQLKLEKDSRIPCTTVLFAAHELALAASRAAAFHP